jgi:hypothetical protein
VTETDDDADCKFDEGGSMMESRTPQPMEDPFAPHPDRDDDFQLSEADQCLLEELPWMLQDHLEQVVREPLGPELLHAEALMFYYWAAELRRLADRWPR